MSRSGNISYATVEATPRLFDAPVFGVYPIEMDLANRCLVEWEHKLGEVHRPFHQEAYGFEVDGQLVGVATSGSIVNGPVAGYDRDQVVELTRLASPHRWACRVVLRLWREVCAQRWSGWPVLAAVSYSHNAMHSGDLYRFDGWRKVRDDAGSSGGGTWGRKRLNTEAVYGQKSLWIWEYAA